MQKRLISMVLALSMALTAMPLPALAQSAPPDTAKGSPLGCGGRAAARHGRGRLYARQACDQGTGHPRMEPAEKAGSGEITIAISRSILSNKCSKAVRRMPDGLAAFGGTNPLSRRCAGAPERVSNRWCPLHRGQKRTSPGRQKLSPQRAFSIVLHPGTPGGLPCGAQYLFFRLGKLFQGDFPAQGGAFVRAALYIGKAYRAVGAGVARALAALVRFQPGGGVGSSNRCTAARRCSAPCRRRRRQARRPLFFST